MDNKKLLDLVKKQVERLSDLLLIEADLDVQMEDGEDEGKIIKVRFDGEDLGYMIGARGRHLSSIQYYLNSVVRKNLREVEDETSVTVLVDVGGYREQRQEGVEKMALQKADDARILGEPVDLAPMSSSDRRVVHMALGKFDDIRTESFGEGRDRYIRITPLSEKELGIIPESEDNDENGEGEESEE